MSDMANIESPATTDARAYVGKGIYQFPFAAQLAKSSQQELRRWLLGLTIKRGRTYSEYEPLWRPAMPWFDGRPSVCNEAISNRWPRIFYARCKKFA